MKWLLSLAIFLVILGLYLDSLVPEEITERRLRVVAMNTGFLLFDSVLRLSEHCCGFGDLDVLKSIPGPTPVYNKSGVKSYDDVIVGVPVRVYTPDSKSGDSPMIVHFHGGGWAIADLNMFHDMVIDLTNRTNAVIISVDYRLAPEHPFPTGLDDCITVTRFVMNNLQNYGVTSGRVFTAGDSAGGHLATVVNGELVKENLFLSGAVLIYPVTQLATTDLPSHRSKSYMILKVELLSKFIVSLFGIPYQDNYRTVVQNRHICRDKQSEEIFSKYLPGVELSDDCDPALYNKMKQMFNPKVSPLFRESLRDLAPTLVLLAEVDVLHDEGVLYYERLKNEGVDSDLKVYKGAFHGYLSGTIYAAIMKDIVHFVKTH